MTRLLPIAIALCATTGTAAAFHTPSAFDDAAANGGGNRMYFTGSPRQKGYDCGICHTDAAKQITANVELSPADPAYRPGQQYTVTITLVGEHRGFGSASNQNSFAAEVVDDLGVPAGSYTVPDQDSVRTIDDARVVGGLSKGRGETVWTFGWQAPAAGRGPLTLHAGVVDGDGASSTTELTDPGGDDYAMAAVRMCETSAGCPDRPSEAKAEAPMAGCNVGGDASLITTIALLFLITRRRSDQTPRRQDAKTPRSETVRSLRDRNDRTILRCPTRWQRFCSIGRNQRNRIPLAKREPFRLMASWRLGVLALFRNGQPKRPPTIRQDDQGGLDSRVRASAVPSRFLLILLCVAGCFDPNVPGECPDHVCNGSNGGGPDANSCSESWQCSTWEAPPGSDQATRTCIDKNMIGTTQCKPNEGPVTLPALDLDKFKCEVQPIFQRACSMMGCHGTDTGRPFRDYARGRFRNNEIVNRTGTCIPQTGTVNLQQAGTGTVMCEGWLPHTQAEWKKNFDSARSFMLDTATPEDSLMLKMPTVGGLPHIEIKLFKPSDPEYATLRDWLAGGTLGRTCDTGRN